MFGGSKALSVPILGLLEKIVSRKLTELCHRGLSVGSDEFEYFP